VLAGILFDVDGTLVDTNYLHTVCWWEALRQYGHDVPMARIHRAVGMGSHRLLAHVLGPDHDPAADADLSAAHRTLYRTEWERLTPLPGARNLIRRCASERLRVVLASSAEAEELSALRRALDVDDAITAATSADDADDSKPEPDILQAAMHAAGLDPDRCVLVGDSVWDVKAALKAGVPCVGLECGGTSAGELRGAGAAEVYPDPAALLDRFDESPLSSHRTRAR